MNKKPMRCPSCRANLKVTGQARLETLEEHVSDPNGTPFMKDKYQCTNKKCRTYTLKLIWNYSGEIYGPFDIDKSIFIDNNDAPFGSIQRRHNIEIYKEDENFTLLNLWFVRFRIVFKYTSNEEGEILDRRWYIQPQTRSDNGMTWTIHRWLIGR